MEHIQKQAALLSLPFYSGEDAEYLLRKSHNPTFKEEKKKKKDLSNLERNSCKVQLLSLIVSLTISPGLGKEGAEHSRLCWVGVGWCSAVEGSSSSSGRSEPGWWYLIPLGNRDGAGGFS